MLDFSAPVLSGTYDRIILKDLVVIRHLVFAKLEQYLEVAYSTEPMIG